MFIGANKLNALKQNWNSTNGYWVESKVKAGVKYGWQIRVLQIHLDELRLGWVADEHRACATNQIAVANNQSSVRQLSFTSVSVKSVEDGFLKTNNGIYVKLAATDSSKYLHQPSSRDQPTR